METGNLLDQGQRQYLQELVDAGQPVGLLRRAQILLLYDEGQPTRFIAQAVGLSRGRVRYWRRRFRAHGMGVIPTEAPGSSLVAVETGSQVEPESKTGREDQPKPVRLTVPEDGLAPTEAAGENIKIEDRASTDLGAESSRDGIPDWVTGVKSPGILPNDTLAEAGRKTLRFHFAAMLKNEAGTRLGADIEALHDMRVATRRMRAAFEVFGSAFKLKVLRSHLKGLRATGRALGRVRDLDVFMEKAGGYLASLPEADRQGLQPLLQVWEQERDAGRAQMIAYLDSPDYLAFKEKFDSFVNTPGAGVQRIDQNPPSPVLVCEIAPVLIYSRLAAVRAYAPGLPSASIEQLHALRIEFKKLRYTVEFFREVLGSEAKPVINEIKGLQDHLGDLNDAQVATQILSEFLTHWDERQTGLPLSERQNPQPVVAYLAYQHAERHRLVQTFPQTWAAFDRPEFRRGLALAVSVL